MFDAGNHRIEEHFVLFASITAYVRSTRFLPRLPVKPQCFVGSTSPSAKSLAIPRLFSVRCLFPCGTPFWNIVVLGRLSLLFEIFLRFARKTTVSASNFSFEIFLHLKEGKKISPRASNAWGGLWLLQRTMAVPCRSGASPATHQNPGPSLEIRHLG